MALESLMKTKESQLKETEERGEKEEFSPQYKIVEDYFNPNPLTCRTCTMGRISKKRSYN
jgi:hypothetical protein